MAGDDLAKRKRGVVDGMADNDSPPSKRRVAHRDDAKVNKAQQKSSTNENKVKSGRTEKKRTVEVGEERLSRFRVNPPKTHLTLLERANTQRMIVIDRKRYDSTPLCPFAHKNCPSEEVILAGTTGNVYTINISHRPSCDCPAYRKELGKGGFKSVAECKHTVYVINKVLKRQSQTKHRNETTTSPASIEPSTDSYLLDDVVEADDVDAAEQCRWQNSLTTNQLRYIFKYASPPYPAAGQSQDGSAADDASRRRPIEGDCGVCCEELDEEVEDIVYCKAACGNNLHKSCFDSWAKVNVGKAGGVTCPYCRTSWENDVEDIVALSKNGHVGEDGYVNLGHELGLSERRDVRTYDPFWVRRMRNQGLFGGYGGDYDDF